MKKKLQFFFLIFFIGAKAQTTAQVDKLLDQSIDLFNDVKFNEANKVLDKAHDISRTINYSSGIVKSTIYKAGILIEQGAYDETLKYLKIAEMQDDFGENDYIVSEFYRIRGRVRANLEFNKYALEDFHKQLYHSKKIKSENQKNLGIFFSYQNLLQSFEKIDNKDSVWNYANKMELSLKNLKGQNRSSSSIGTYTKIASLYINDLDWENAQIYNKKAEKIAISEKNPVKMTIYENFAIIENNKKNFEKASEYYEKAFMNAHELKLLDFEKYYAVELAQFYKDRNRDKSLKFYALASSLENSISKSNINATNKLIEELIISKQRNHKKLSKLILITALVLLSIVFFMFKYYIEKYKRKIKYKKNLIEEKQDIIFYKEDQNRYLVEENKHLSGEIVNNRLKELIDLAKGNEQGFFVLFKELYPNFICKLKELNPEIRNNELIFCAYSFLNFSTKDISEYTFVTVAAVQSRKNRFRKKYNIDSKIDFNTWMRELGEK